MASMVRATDKAKEILKRCAAKAHKAQTVVLEQALEAYERMQFLEDVKNGFIELRNDPTAWKAYREEVEAWDATIGDGLPAEDPQ